jgi:hypothetical protein
MAKIVFNKVNVAKYLGIKTGEIVTIVPDNSEIATVVLKDCFYKVTKQELKGLMINDRKQRIDQVEIHSFGKGEYIAHNKDKENSYIIRPKKDYVRCECEDYHWLSVAFDTDKMACKHIYKYLNLLGVNNLLEYSQLFDQQVENLEEIVA